MRGYPGVSVFTVRYTTRGKCKTREKGTGKWLERRSAGGKRVKFTYYKARLMRQGRVFFLGHFDTPEAAAEAYRKAKEKPPAGASRRGSR
jgi:hypothetical protein